MISTAARNAASILKCVVSSKCASGAALRGAAVRRESLSSRRNRSARTSCSSAGSPRAFSSRVRRLARTSGVATTNSFTSAPGAITVPISRPSSTAPGAWSRIDAESSSKPGAPRGIAATTEAASVIGCAFSDFSSNLVGSSATAAAMARPASSRRIAGVEHRFRHRPVDQTGVEMMQAIHSASRLGDRALARGGRSIDGDNHCRSRFFASPRRAARPLCDSREVDRSKSGTKHSASTKSGVASIASRSPEMDR